MISLISYSINRRRIHSKVEKYEEADLKSENVSHFIQPIFKKRRTKVFLT